MADIVQKIKITADGSQAEKGAKKTTASMAKSFAGAQLAVQAFNKAMTFAGKTITDAVSAAVEYEKTTAQLSVALRSAGYESDAVLTSLQNQASAMEELTNISDEQIRRMQAMAISAGS